MAREEVPKGLQTKDMVRFTKLVQRIVLLERMLQQGLMQQMQKGQRLGQMLEGVTEKKRELLGMAPSPKHELPGQEEESSPPIDQGFGQQTEDVAGRRGGY